MGNITLYLWPVLILCIVLLVAWLTYNEKSPWCSLYGCMYHLCEHDHGTPMSVIPMLIDRRHSNYLYDRVNESRQLVLYHDSERAYGKIAECGKCFSLSGDDSHWIKMNRHEYYHLVCLCPILIKYVIDRCLPLCHLLGDPMRVVSPLMYHALFVSKKESKILAKC